MVIGGSLRKPWRIPWRRVRIAGSGSDRGALEGGCKSKASSTDHTNHSNHSKHKASTAIADRTGRTGSG